MNLLRCAPLLLSTASLNFSYNQYLFLQPFVSIAEDPETQVNAVLGPYIRHQFPAGLATILTLYPATWAASVANIYLGKTKGLYTAGLVFSIGHLLWARRAKELMERIASENSVDLLKEWLALHRERTLLADVPAWVCFAAAFYFHRR